MAEENAVAGNDETPPVPPRVAWWQRLRQAFVSLIASVGWLTEHSIALLRLFATSALFLIVIIVVWNAANSAQSVVVKPFSVPKRMTDTHADAGRILANTLKQHLLEAEEKIARSMQQGSSENIAIETTPAFIISSQKNDIQSADIKLPETGISIDDVVAFMASIFGRENLNGSLYEDSGRLYLQLELKGRIFLFVRELPTDKPQGLYLDLLNAMLQESRQKILSIASEEYNLYYYCSGVVDSIEHTEVQQQQLFDYCTTLRSRDIDAERLLALQHELAQLKPDDLAAHTPLARHVLNLLKGQVQQKARLLCLDTGQTNGVCQQVVQSKGATAKLTPRRTPIRQPETNVMVMLVAPDIQLNWVEQLQQQCAEAIATPLVNVQQSMVQQVIVSDISTQEIQRSSMAENEATTLLHNKLYAKSAERFQEAISLNCRNAVAWANFGILLSLVDNQARQLEQSQQALQVATRLNTTAGWMQHSLCVTEAVLAGLPFEQGLALPSCQEARSLEPANTVLYDKLFYLSIADEYFAAKQYSQAYQAYQEALRTDRKRDCRLSHVVERLAMLGSQHNVQGAGQVACALLRDAYTVPESEPTQCEKDLQYFERQCAA